MKAVWLSSTYYLDPRVMALSADADRLFVRSIAYCGVAETRGFVPDRALKTLGISAVFRRKSELVSSGLWVSVEGGIRLSGWENWNRSGDDLLQRRESDRNRQARRRSLSRDTSRDVTPPEESREEKKESGETRASARTTKKKLSDIPDDWKPNDTHRAKAASRGVDLDHEAEQMRTWAIGKGERKANWDQAFHHWLGNARPTWKSAGTDAPTSSPAGAEQWLRGQWTTGSAKAVAERARLSYSAPDVPDNLNDPERIRTFMVSHARDWISANHAAALAALSQATA